MGVAWRRSTAETQQGATRTRTTSKKSTTSPITILAACVLILGGAAGTVYLKVRADGRNGNGADASVTSRMRIDALLAATETITTTIDARGFLQAHAVIEVSPEVEARAVSRHVDAGDRVKPGDLLYRLDDTLYALAVKQAEANLEAARSDQARAAAAVNMAAARVESAEAEQQYALDEYNRYKRLEALDTAAERELLRATTAKRSADAAMRLAQAGHQEATAAETQAQAAIALAAARLEQAQEQLSKCAVKVPTVTGPDDDGQPAEYTVAAVYAEAGDFVAPGKLGTQAGTITAEPLVKLVRLEEMKMQVFLTGREVSQIRTAGATDGTRAGSADVAVTVHVDALGSNAEPLPATIHHVSPIADPVSRKFQVEFRVPNDGGSLLDGMFGRIRIACGETVTALVLPKHAVFRRDAVDCCYVVEGDGEDDRLVLRSLELESVPGRADVARVRSGLEPGERVAVSGLRELKEEMAVEVRRLLDRNQRTVRADETH